MARVGEHREGFIVAGLGLTNRGPDDEPRGKMGGELTRDTENLSLGSVGDGEVPVGVGNGIHRHVTVRTITGTGDGTLNML